MKAGKVLSSVAQGQSLTERGFSVIGGIITAVLGILVTIDVILRYVFNSPIPGLYELTEFMLIGAIYLGIAYLQSQRGHVRIEILTDRLSPGAQRILNMLGYVIGIIVFALIAWQAGRLAWVAWSTHDYSSGLVQWPTWPAKSVVPLGAGLLCLRLIRDLVQELVKR